MISRLDVATKSKPPTANNMPAPEGNKFAAKPASERAGDSFTLRAPTGLKGRAVRASRKRKMKLSPWLIEAIEDQCEREGVK